MMKRLFLMCVCLMNLGILMAAVAPGENILINGEFHGQPHDPVTGLASKVPDYWGTAANTDYLSYRPSGAPSGKGYVRLTQLTPDKPGQEVIVKQAGIKVIAGEKYRISAMVRTNGFESSHCGIVVYDRGWYHEIGISQFPKQQDWTRMEREFTMIPTTQDYYTFAIFACNFQGSIDVSDVKLEAVSEKARKYSGQSSMAKQVAQLLFIPWKPLLNQIPIPRKGTFDWLTGRKYPEMQFLLTGKLEEGTEFNDYDLHFSINGRPEICQPLVENFNTIQFTENVKPGDFLLKVCIVHRATGKVILEQNHDVSFVILPETSDKGHRRLNNLVVEILNAPIKRTEASQSYEFCTMRNGWVFIAVQNAASEKLEIVLDGKLTVIQARTPRLETFRDIAAGQHSLTVKGAANGGTLVVRSIPEILNYKPCMNSMLPENPKYDWAFQEKYVHYAVTTHNDGEIPEKEREDFFGRGYKWLGSVAAVYITPEVMLKRLNTCPGMNAPQYQGVTCDELFYGSLNSTIPYAAALKQFVPKNDHVIYTWITGRPSVTGHDNDFLATCINSCHGRGRLISEVYCGTKPTLAEAESYLEDAIVNRVKSFKASYPGVINHWGLIFGNFIQIPVISLAHHPNVDYKYYLDMQFNLLANHPECQDMAITGYWGTRHCDFELYRWCFMLTRHYCIEGKKNMLSEEYGFTYAPGHIGNGDFQDGLNLWTARGNVTTGKQAGYSTASQCRWGGNNGAGDTFAVLTKNEAEVSSVTQTAKNLVPGRIYCLQLAVVDYNDLKAKKFNPRRVGIDVTLGEGAEIDRSQSWVHVDKRENGQYDYNRLVPKCNLHHVLFKATKPEVEVTIHNTAATKGEAAAVNYVMLNPYLEEK